MINSIYFGEVSDELLKMNITKEKKTKKKKQDISLDQQRVETLAVCLEG